MSAEQRGRQKLNRNHSTRRGLRAKSDGQKSQFKLELETNSWLRIGLVAKDKQLVFTNLLCHFTVANLRAAFRALDGSKAAGISGMTKRDYAKNLDANLEGLVSRLHRGTYRPSPKRGAKIPKANGGTRPIAISEFEDKLVEWLLAKTLTAVYEPLFIRNSFGSRPKRSAKDAIKAVFLSLKDNKRPSVVEIDLARFFDTMSHRILMKLLKRRITDKRLTGLIGRFLEAGILDLEGDLKISETGIPQGSVMSPVLANVFLHYALDTWFIENYASNGGIIVRYVDDAVFIFDKERAAEDFMPALKVRLEAFGLKLNKDKSGMINFEKKSGEVFHFLGFTFFWGKDRGGTKQILKVKTHRGTLGRKVQEFTDWIKSNRSRMKLDLIWDEAAAKLRGHYEYYGVHTNRPRLNHYYYAAIGSLFKWLNRRSQKKSFDWERFKRRLMYKPLPEPPKVARLQSLFSWKWGYAR